MILVFILLGIITLLAFILFLLVISTLKIEVEKLTLTNMKQNHKPDYSIKIALCLNNINWLWVTLTDERIEKLIAKIPFYKIDFKKLENDFTFDDIKTLGKLHIIISKLKLKASLGFESPILTAFTISFISSAIAIALPHLIKKWEKERYVYVIQPIYQNKNLYKIKLNCIIKLKVVNIINVIYIFIKKGKSDKNERTASNRKPYAYSHE